MFGEHHGSHGSSLEFFMKSVSYDPKHLPVKHKLENQGFWVHTLGAKRCRSAVKSILTDSLEFASTKTV